MDRNFPKKTIFAFFLILLLAAGSAWAQNVGSLQGTVTDPKGAAIAGAKVTATDLASGIAHSAETDNTGEYSFAQLAPGTYKVEVTKAGFKTYVASKVSVLVATPTSLEIRLELGEMSQQVIVESAAPALNTEDATVGNPFEEQQVKSLPFLARNVVNLLTLQPGVVFTGRSDTDRLSMGSIATLDPREGVVDGVRGNQSNITVDGVDANDWQNQAAFTSALPLTLDSVQEFRVTTTNANATNGLTGGAQVQVVLKSGSNEYHGNARWYYRTTGTSADSFFNNAVGRPRAKDQRNIGGGSIGGPIRRDRLYFFLDNEERREAVGATGSRIVPTDTLRDGVLIYKCKTASQCPGATVLGHTIPAGFEGLSPTDIKSLDPAVLGVNAAMSTYMGLFPHGNDSTQGLDANPTGAQNFIGFTFNPPVLTFNNIYMARFDYNITRNGHHSIFWRGSMQGLKTDLTPAQFPGQSAAAQLLNNSRGYVLQYQGQLTPTLINTARYGYTRQGVAQSGTVGTRFAVRSFDDILNFAARPIRRVVPVHELNDDLSWIKGKHTLQTGGVVRFVLNDRVNEGSSFPSFFVNNGFCAGLCNDVANELGAATGPGSSFPAPTNKTAITRSFMMLTGSITQVNATFFANPSSGSIFPAGTPEQRSFAERVAEGYIQDSWRLRSNMTFTYGVRYGYETPVWETDGFQVSPSFDIMQWFQSRIVNMNNGVPSDASPLLSWIPAGKANGGANSWYKPYHKDIAPRLSLAYSPGYDSGVLKSIFGGPGKSSLRVGAGVFYDKVGQALAVDSDLSGSPGTATALIDGSQQFSLATAQRFSGSCSNAGCSGLPAAGPPFFTPPTKATFPFTPPANVSALGFAVDPHLRTPYTFHLTTSFQRELPRKFVVDVSYVGTLGRRLLGKIDYAQYLDIRDPKSGADLWSAYRQLAVLSIDPTDISPTGVPSIQSIPFFDDLLPNMPAFADAFYPGSGYANLTATQAFYAFTVRNAAPSWSCALFPFDTFVSPGGLPSPWNTTVDPQRDGLVLFQPQFQTLPGWSNFANSNYHSLQISVRRNVGIASFAANYVFSKSIDNDSSAENADFASGGGTLTGLIQNPYDLRAGRGLSDFNLRHNFSGNWVVDLPIGRGRRFLGGANRIVDALVGGWEFAGTARWHSGFPFGPANGFNFPTNFFLTTPGTVTGPLHTSITRDGTFKRPNLFPDANAAFALVNFTLPGLAGSRNVLTGPAYATADMGLHKAFKMPWSERQRIQFRVTAFNVFNSVNFNNFSINPESPGTFGNITSTAGPQTGSAGARDMEFAIRFEF